jgi:hypothetical protein
MTRDRSKEFGGRVDVQQMDASNLLYSADGMSVVLTNVLGHLTPYYSPRQPSGEYCQQIDTRLVNEA